MIAVGELPTIYLYGTTFSDRDCFQVILRGTLNRALVSLHISLAPDRVLEGRMALPCAVYEHGDDPWCGSWAKTMMLVAVVNRKHCATDDIPHFPHAYRLMGFLAVWESRLPKYQDARIPGSSLLRDSCQRLGRCSS